MEDKIVQAFNVANYMATFSSQKQILKEEYNQNLLFFYNGGSFVITKELITFVKTIKDLTDSFSFVLPDSNDLPIQIDDISDFLDKILSKYIFATNQYFTRYNSLKSSRTIESLLDK